MCAATVIGSCFNWHMTLPRRILINPEATAYYHCVSRCVRRAFLCGKDSLTGYDFEHRRGWIESRLIFLADAFCIDVCAYAVMSNHYHLVLHINCDEVAALDDEAVIERWQMLHRLPDWFEAADADEHRVVKAVALWRDRLVSISWFMKSLNEPLARLANKEDGCKGRFWEGRFKSQALLDEASVLKCMAYVDLNPIRAQMAATLEESDYTSIQARIEERDQSLAPLSDEVSGAFCVPISKANYINLVDWTGRQIRPDKRGAIGLNDVGLPPIIAQLRHEQTPWREELINFTRRYCRAIGSSTSLLKYRDWLGQSRLNGVAVG